MLMNSREVPEREGGHSATYAVMVIEHMADLSDAVPR